ncbi:MAG: HAMP domain-containing histidine kinase [Phycisphaerales bacterium]|nr:HAMP domain-containing histidine kinase [Phycisphaerales bacterium]
MPRLTESQFLRLGNQSAPHPEQDKRQLPLRVRLMLWMLAIFLIVQLSIAFVFRLYLARAIDEFFADRAVERVDAIAEAILPELPSVTDTRLAEIVAQHFVLLHKEGVKVDVLDASGTPIVTTRPPAHALEISLFQRASDSENAFSVRSMTRPIDKVSTPDRIAISRVEGPDKREYIVVLTASDSNAATMQELTTRMIMATIPVGILPIALSAYLIAGFAVRPLADIRDLAQRLSPESIDQSIENAPAASEVSDVRKELELARQRIEAGFAAQERFMSNVSHELKTPIAVVLTGVQALKSDDASKPVKEFLRGMTEELEKLARTVDNFLLLTRVRHNKGVIPAVESCAMRDVLLDSYASCVSMAGQHKVRLGLRVPEGEDMDATVEGNADLLRIIFDNLIRNAIRFSPEGDVVEIDAVASDAEITVQVRDRGPGIPPALLPRVFDRFSQAKDEERRGRGHGLGLEIALGIAELHRGSITVRNREPSGCEFTVTLPRHQTLGLVAPVFERSPDTSANTPAAPPGDKPFNSNNSSAHATPERDA